MKIDWKRKIMGMPLIYLLMIGTVSAAIIGVYIFANITAIGTYQSTPIARGFSIEDGDTSDAVTYIIDQDNVYLSFPLYANQPEGVSYTKVLKIVPDGTVTSLTFSNVNRTANGITSALMGFYKDDAPEIGYVNIPNTPTPASYSFPVMGNHIYYVDFLISTGDYATTETATLTTNGKNYIAQKFGLSNCYTASGLSWTAVATDGTQVNETGGTANIIGRLVTTSIYASIILNGTTYTYAQLRTANDNTDLTLADAQWVAANDGTPAGEAQYCYQTVITKSTETITFKISRGDS